jgi:hypothetical protein
MARDFVRVSVPLGVLLFVLGLSLALCTLPTALMVTGAVLLLAAGVATWIASISWEGPAAKTEQPVTTQQS